MKLQTTYEMKKALSEKPLKWYWFLTFVRSPIGIISFGIFALNSIFALLSAESNIIYYTCKAVVSIINFVFYIINYKNLRNFKNYNQIIIGMFIEAILFSVSYMETCISNITLAMIMMSFCIIIYMLIWFLPNYIYLKKRINLFD